MYIIGVTKIDKQGRVLISGLFGEEKISKVIVAVDVESESIILLPADKGSNFGIPINVDDKNRIFLPKWIRDELESVEELTLVVDGDNHYLMPKTGSVLPYQTNGPCAD